MQWKKQYMTYFNSEVNYNCIKRYALIIDLINNCDESHWIKGKKSGLKNCWQKRCKASSVIHDVTR